MHSLLTPGPVLRVMRRRDICDDAVWYGGPFYRDNLAVAGLDDCVLTTFFPSPDQVQILFLQRRAGREPFGRAVIHLLRALWTELARLQPHDLRSVDQSTMTTLPPRMLQVLACLLAGHTAKETAALLEVSVHTVQEHVKRLYKRSGATNRAELAECYRHAAPILMTMSVSDMVDHRQQIVDATRHPWPAEGDGPA